MSESKFTPGPWSVEENVLAGGVNHLAVTNREAAPDWMPCSITPMDKARPVDYANARLIAAAPELLDALERMLSPRFDGQQWLRDLEFAKSVFLKAKGQP